MSAHEPRYRGIFHPVDVTCACGWVAVGLRSRSEALRAFRGHKWLVSRSVAGYVAEIDEDPPQYRPDPPRRRR